MDTLFQLSSELVQWQEKFFSCSVGSGGFIEKELKQEGDKKTPIGRFSFMCLYYRPDKIQKIETSLPLIEITRNLGWCDDPKSSYYNMAFNSDEAHVLGIDSYENMWRLDGRYDLVVVVSHNLNPILPGKGSAIFIHCNNGESTPYVASDGCLKFNKNDLLNILKTASVSTVWDLTKMTFSTND